MTTLDRDELALRMLAAWVNVSIDLLPNHPCFRTYPNQVTLEAWDRVGRAALDYYREHKDDIT